MKDRLTAEQSARLIELGVDPSKASGFECLDPYGLDDAIPTGVPLYTLSDLLSLLPKEIYSEERDIFYRLNMTIGKTSSSVYYRHYGYVKGFGPMKSADELIDALYELLIWCIKEKFVKL